MRIKRSEILIPVISIVAVVGLWLLSFNVIVGFTFSPENANLWASRGQVGDMFGAVNALFSGLAFAGIIYTIYLQRQELREQRKELRLTRREFEQQNNTLSLQRFEKTLFDLLSLHNQLVDNLRYKGLSGRQIFKVLGERLPLALTSEPNIGEPTRLLNRSDTYIKYFEEIKPHVQLYLNSLQVMYFLIKGSGHADTLYLKVLAAYITEHEEVFLFYHCQFMPENQEQVMMLKQLARDLDLFRTYKLTEHLRRVLYGIP